MALACWFAGGVLALALNRVPRWSSRIGVGAAVAGGLVGLWPALKGLVAGGGESLVLPWGIPGGEFHIALDALSCFFLVPVCLLSVLAALYGGGYMAAYRGRKALGPHWFCFNLFIAGMVLVLAARQVLVFLVAWEVMSLAAFGLVIFEHEKLEVRAAGWIYLMAAHVGAALLMVMFLLLGKPAGSLDFTAMAVAPRLAPGLAAVVFLLAFVAFGTKAGVVPFHIWLPEAHPAAPSHVSALMSGVMIKIGLYGLLRTMTLLGAPAGWWGPVLLAAGFVGALAGISSALFQRDVKRVLAYSSIENIGLILMAFGIGLWGLTQGHRWVAVLGLAGGMFHIWNHALMKGLMFLAAGGVLHGAGTRDLERLGGLLKRMPITGALMIAGALALAATPPLNGFLSEWLIYLGLIEGGLEATGGARVALLLLVGGVALVGGLALMCFVRLVGMVWLGECRSDECGAAHELPARMWVPMGILAAACGLAAAFPLSVLRLCARPVESVFGLPAEAFLAPLTSTAAPLRTMGVMNVVVMATLLAGGLLFSAVVRRRPRAEGPTWGCGYPMPTPRMQYTGLSFSELIISRLFPGLWRPKTRLTAPQGLFPARSMLSVRYPDTLSRILYQPSFDWLVEHFTRLRWVQQGKLHCYLVYFVVTLVVAFAWMAVRRWVIHE